jgi:hypothetical protein
MVRFIVGLIIGILLGAAAVVVFTMLGSMDNSLIYAPLPSPSAAVVHVTVDAGYLNQELNTLLATQPQFAGARPQLELRSPNTAVFSADIPVTVNGNTIKVRPTVTMQFQVQDGVLSTHVTSVNLGTINVPMALIQSQVNEVERLFQSSVNRAVTNALAGSGLKLYSVSTSPTAITVDLGQ